MTHVSLEYYYLIFALLSCCGATAAEDVVLVDKDTHCDAYCFKVLKPMLEHISVMQERWEVCGAIELANTSSRLEKIESQLVAQEAKDNSYATAIKEYQQQLKEQKSLIEKQKESLRKPFEKIGNKYYYIENKNSLNWFGAAHKCLEFGGHLISLDNLEELNLISRKLNSQYAYWTDVNDLSEEGVYLSLTTGVKPQFLNWRSGEPNNAGKSEHCVYIIGTNFQMNDFRCELAKYFICESFDE